MDYNKIDKIIMRTLIILAVILVVLEVVNITLDIFIRDKVAAKTGDIKRRVDSTMAKYNQDLKSFKREDSLLNVKYDSLLVVTNNIEKKREPIRRNIGVLTHKNDSLHLNLPIPD